MTKKDRNLDLPFKPPVVRVSLVEPGSRLDLAAQALGAQNTEADRAVNAELQKYRDSLAPEISAAQAGLAALGHWEKANAADLKLLRSLSFDGARGVAEENLRVSAQNRVVNLFQVISKTRDTLITVEQRVVALKPSDLTGPRMHSDAPGIRSYYQLAPAPVEQIRFDVQRAARTVLHLDRILGEAQGAVTTLAANLEKVTRVRARDAAVSGAVKSTATALDPDLIAARAASRPGPVQTKADSAFTGYEAHDKK